MRVTLPTFLPAETAPLTRLRQRLDNLPVGRKLLAALLVLLATVLLVANPVSYTHLTLPTKRIV